MVREHGCGNRGLSQEKLCHLIEDRELKIFVVNKPDPEREIWTPPPHMWTLGSFLKVESVRLFGKREGPAEGKQMCVVKPLCTDEGIINPQFCKIGLH